MLPNSDERKIVEENGWQVSYDGMEIKFMNNAAIKIENELSPMTKTEFEQKLRDIGKERYHDNCKFHHLLHSGMLNKGQVQAWALNRYYYQINISIKDSALMSRIKKPRTKKSLG